MEAVDNTCHTACLMKGGQAVSHVLQCEFDLHCVIQLPMAKFTEVQTHLTALRFYVDTAAYLAQLKYDSVILELITTGAVIAFVFRAFLGYKRLNERYFSCVECWLRLSFR